ncbi:MAG: hypothetical protein HY886_10245 [Deltaproteobacteria bacterium]|nr:hypothetical protein [Deltaproteobacteria bacterium]
MGTFGLFLAIALVNVAGMAIGSFFGLSFRERLLFAWPIGAGVVSLQMFFYSLASIPFSPAVIGWPWIGFTIALLAWRIAAFFSNATRGGAWSFTFSTRYAASRSVALSPLETALVLVIVFQVVFSLMNLVALPVQGYDTWVIWFLKAKAFFIDSGVSAAFLSDPVYSNANPGAYEYPILVPLLVSAGYVFMGYVDDRLVKIFFWLYYLNLLGAFYYFVRPFSTRLVALILCAMLATVPRIMEQAAFGGAGYADMPLAVYFLAATGFGFRFFQEGKKNDFLLSALFLSIGAWTKSEGITFLASVLIIMSAYAVYTRRREGIKIVIPAVVIAVLFVLPWRLYVHTLPKLSFTMVSELSVSTVLSNMERLPFILKVIVPKLFTANKYHITWALYAVLTLWGFRSFTRREYAFLQAALWIQLSFYIFVYVITPFDLKPHIETSFDRLTIHLLPIAFLCMAVCWKDIFAQGDARRVEVLTP